jgi:LysR family hca operon transcriptional activator
MELRHLRYFIAVAEEGSLKLAAEKRLFTAHPSLSRQMRDLETEIGFQLMTRSVRGIQLTEAGQSFLDHARLAVSQVEAATAAARRVGQPARPVFSLGCVVGHEADCLPAATSILQGFMPNTEIRVFSGFSTTLAADLLRGSLDLAFLRREPEPGLAYRLVVAEPLVVILPRTHRLAARKTIDVSDLGREIFIGISRVPRVLRGVVMDYLEQAGVAVVPRLEIDNFAMAISLVESEGGFAILPGSVQSALPSSVVSRRLSGAQPTIDLVMGYRKENACPVLAKVLGQFDHLASQMLGKAPGGTSSVRRRNGVGS